MTAQNFTSRFRLVFKRGSRSAKIAVCAAVVLSAVALLVLHSATRSALEKANALRDQAAQLEQENDRLESQIDGLGSVDSVEQIAQNELGLVKPDTIIIQPEN